METVGACSSSSNSQQYLDAYTCDVRESWATYNFNGSDEDHRFLYQDEDVSILHEINEKGHDLFERFVSRFEKHVQINEKRRQYFRKTLDHYRERAAGNSELIMFEKLVGDQLNRKGCKSRERGTVNGDVFDKLERFKVKTVNVIGVGVVKEEQEQK